MKIAALIPVYNEARTLTELVAATKPRVDTVYVIDDGSTDNSGEIGENAGAVLVTRPENGGKGKALRDGLNRCFADGFDAVVCLDGDGQHLPEEIKGFTDVAESADLAIGNRMEHTETMPFVRKMTNRFTSWVLGRLCQGKARVADTQCGFRLIGKRCWEGIEIRSHNFEFEGEMIVAAARAGFRVVNVPVSTVYGEEKSKINPIVDTVRFFKMIWRLWRQK